MGLRRDSGQRANALEASKLSGCLPYDMDGLTGLHGRKLLDQTDEEDLCTVRLQPISPTAWTPALLAGGLIGNGDGGGEQILNCITHGSR